jgi:hypothetical protein
MCFLVSTAVGSYGVFFLGYKLAPGLWVDAAMLHMARIRCTMIRCSSPWVSMSVGNGPDISMGIWSCGAATLLLFIDLYMLHVTYLCIHLHQLSVKKSHFVILSRSMLQLAALHQNVCLHVSARLARVSGAFALHYIIFEQSLIHLRTIAHSTSTYHCERARLSFLLVTVSHQPKRKHG